LTGKGEPVQLNGGHVSAHYFDIFGMKAALGRTFAPDEDQLGKEHVVVLRHALWESRFGSDPGLIGRTIRLDNEPYTVIGVLPAGGSFDRAFNQLWLPLAFKPENMTRNFHWFGSIARLKQGVTLEQARMQMSNAGLCRIGCCQCCHLCVQRHFVRHNHTEYASTGIVLRFAHLSKRYATTPEESEKAPRSLTRRGAYLAATETI
jgi:MacB-like periplasmic core domain